MLGCLQVLLAIFFHNCGAAVKVEGANGVTSGQPSSSSKSPSSTRVKAEVSVKAEGTVTSMPTAPAPQLPTYLAALKACELFSSFASALCLPSLVTHRVLELLMAAAPPSADAQPLPTRPAQSVDQDVFRALVHEMYGTGSNNA